ncbi:MAG TPA: NmrA/HSCARG family protein [Gemmatimonadaceae bacterium]|nr:NmrA/HSCARG family protein [Gemmatimonadaceae bacterium]
MADTRKIIAVVGATGAQGGGLVRAILADASSGFTARALTRDVHSPQAQELARLGAEVVHADLDDPPTVARAFEGAYGAYCVTFYWAHFSPEREQANARTMAEAAKAAKLQHVIWSTLEDTRRWVPVSDDRMPTLLGNYKVPHFDAKGASDHFFTDLGLPVTFLLTSFYWDNLYMFGMGPKKAPDGTYTFTIPMADKKLPGIAADDIGKIALAIFKRGREYIGKTIAIAGEHLSGDEMASRMSEAFGIPIQYNAVSHDAYRGFGFPGADDLGNMFQFKCDFESAFRAPRDVDATRKLHPTLQTFAQWLARNKEKVTLG